MDSIALFSRCVHILGAVILFGGAIFIRHILLPSAETLGEETHARLREQVSRRWRIVVGAAIAMLLFSGLYNFVVVLVPQHRGDKFYHMWMGIKILLAFVVFFFASALPGRSAKLAWVRNKSKFWMSFTIALATAVVVIASMLKVRGPAPVKAEPPAVNAPVEGA